MVKHRSELESILAPLGNIVKGLKDRRIRLGQERDQIDAEIEQIDAELHRLGGQDGGGTNGRAKRGAGKRQQGVKVGRRKGTRRTRQQLEAQAKQVIDFIAAGGKEGRSGREVKAKFGQLPGVKAWLKQYAPDSKIRTEGKKAAMRYFGG